MNAPWAMSQNPMDPDPVVNLPFQTNGYLILNSEGYPNVQTWMIEVQTRTESQSGNVTFTTVYSKQIVGMGYSTIPYQYGHGDYYLKVRGFDANGIQVVDRFPSEIDGAECWRKACSKGCIGKTYAYWIDLFVNESNSSSNFSARPYVHPETGGYAYEYMSPTVFSAKGLNPNYWKYYYNVPWWLLGGPGVGVQIIKLNGVVSGDGLKDASNNTLTGTVYGVKKDLGEWRGVFIESNEIASGEGQCIQNLGYFINRVNSGTDWDGRPNLTCNGTAVKDNDPPIDNSGSGVGVSANGCFQSVGLWEDDDDPNGPEFDIFDFADAIGVCLNNSNAGPITSIWASDIREFTITPIAGGTAGGTAPVTFTKDDFIDQNGNFLFPSITLQPGFYVMGMHFTGANYRSRYFEVSQAKSYAVDVNNILSPTFYQVPIVGNSFIMDLEARVGVSFDYELLDLQGNMIYSERITVPGGQVTQKQIQPTTVIPSGILLNRFVFDDGSVIAKMTSK